MLRLALALALGATFAGLWTGGGAAASPSFYGRISSIGPKLAAYMTGRSYRPGCPVPLRDLRVLMVAHWGFDGRVHTGHVVVHGEVARDVLGVLRRLFAARFPIRRLRLVDDYRASDYRSIEADNTSAFNCRYVDGTTRWSEHAYGRAIDVNPIENPYVSGGSTSHPASVRFVDRSRRRAGMAYEGGALVEAFRSAGWGWGGSWSGAQDYQHFSSSGS